MVSVTLSAVNIFSVNRFFLMGANLPKDSYKLSDGMAGTYMPGVT
jgi:hypothetical protein